MKKSTHWFIPLNPPTTGGFDYFTPLTYHKRKSIEGADVHVIDLFFAKPTKRNKGSAKALAIGFSIEKNEFTCADFGDILIKLGEKMKKFQRNGK